MKTLKVLLQEVVSGIKAWVNSNFAQESNAVHKTGNETVNGVKTFTGNVFQNQAGGTNVYCATCDGAVKGDLTSSGTFSIVCKDGSNANMETSGLAAVYMGQDTSGSYVALRADTSYNNTRYNASVSLDIDPTTANNNAIFRPRRDNTIDLGSSSYQFKNLYANNYYYKGTAWGLDKENVWTVKQTYSAVTYGETIRLKDTGLDLSVNGNTGLSGTYQHMIHWVDNNDTAYSTIQSWTNNSENILVLRSRYRTDANTVRTSSIRNQCTANVKSLYPESSVDTDLGTTNNKWKSFNGVNPGALSLPDYDSTAKLNLTSTFPAPDSNGNILYTPTMSGWLYICFDISNATTNDSIFYIQAKDNNVANANFVQTSWMLKSGGTNSLAIFFPVVANKQFIIQINFTGYTLTKVFLIPGLGHVA